MKVSRSRISRSKTCRRAGFTLIEILIVLAIIGVIAAIAVPNLMNQQKSATNKAAKLAINNVQQACELYAVNNNGEPPVGGDEALQLLVQVGPNKEPAVLTKLPTDPWGRQLHYQYPNTKAPVQTDRPAIWSDGKDPNDPSDDINNWDDLVQK